MLCGRHSGPHGLGRVGRKRQLETQRGERGTTEGCGFWVALQDPGRALRHSTAEDEGDESTSSAVRWVTQGQRVRQSSTGARRGAGGGGVDGKLQEPPGVRSLSGGPGAGRGAGGRRGRGAGGASLRAGREQRPAQVLRVRVAGSAGLRACGRGTLGARRGSEAGACARGVERRTWGVGCGGVGRWAWRAWQQRAAEGTGVGRRWVGAGVGRVWAWRAWR